MGKPQWHFWFLQEVWHIKTKMFTMHNEYAAVSPISSEDWFLNWPCFHESSESSSKPKKKKKGSKAWNIFSAWCYKQIHKLNWRELLVSHYFLRPEFLWFLTRTEWKQMLSVLVALPKSAPGLCLLCVTLSLKFIYSWSPK